MESGWLNAEERDRLAREALAGYLSGPDAPLQATTAALVAAATAQAVVLVEGISDQIAVETLARCQGLDLHGSGVVVVPMGGAHGVRRFLDRYGPDGAGLRVVGLYDAAEEDIFRRALTDADYGSPRDRTDLEALGFFVCDADLEAELIRAAGRSSIEVLLESQGDLGSFQTLQKQAEWRDREFTAQVRRYLGAGARRKSRYARLLIESLDVADAPRPLRKVLERVTHR